MRLQRDREQLLPHLEPKNMSRGGEQKRRFHRNTSKFSSRDQAALAAIRFSSHRRTISVTTRLTTTTSRTTTCCGTCRTIHLRSGFRRRHACRNGRVYSASTNLPRRNIAWGSLACGNFSRGSYTGGIITSTSARASLGAGARVCTRTSAYTCFCGT